MKSKTFISLIIPFYKRLDFLKLILQGIQQQSYKNFEVIIAEDNDAQETKDFLKETAQTVDFRLHHVFQEDKGFQKSKIMNKAISIAKGEFVVFIDGDCIPHRHFLKEYAKNKEENYALFGRRVKMSEKITQKLIKNNSIKEINLLSLIISGSDRVEDGIYLPFRTYKNTYRGICGCNWGVSKQYLLEVNGYDEDYRYAGTAEDLDIEWRLIKKGVKLKKMKNKAIVYHLYHDANYTFEQEKINLDLMEKKKKEGKYYCRNGINKN